MVDSGYCTLANSSSVSHASSWSFFIRAHGRICKNQTIVIECNAQWESSRFLDQEDLGCLRHMCPRVPGLQLWPGHKWWRLTGRPRQQWTPEFMYKQLLLRLKAAKTGQTYISFVICGNWSRNTMAKIQKNKSESLLSALQYLVVMRPASVLLTPPSV